MANESNEEKQRLFGKGSDAAYLAAGGLEGITRLVDRFYTIMETWPEARALRALHAENLTESREKLTAFLSGWMGGPSLYAERYGKISLPMSHQHLPVDDAMKQAWLGCMAQALEELGYPETFSQALLARLSIPAEAMRLMSEYRQGTTASQTDFYDAS